MIKSFVDAFVVTDMHQLLMLVKLASHFSVIPLSPYLAEIWSSKTLKGIMLILLKVALFSFRGRGFRNQYRAQKTFSKSDQNLLEISSILFDLF